VALKKPTSFERYFEDNADRYFEESYVSDSTERFYFENRRRLVNEFIGPAQGRILDIGAGPGILSLPLLERPGSTLVVVDISERMLAIVRDQIDRLCPLHRDAVTLLREDILKVDFPVNSFDCILCIGVLAHVSDVTQLIRKIASWMTESGKAVIQITDSAHPAGFLQVFRANSRNIYQYRINHTRSLRMVKAFKASGLVVTKKRRYHLRLPGMRKLGPSLLTRIEKAVDALCAIPLFSFLGQDVIYQVVRKER
jgi:2-polyprenyl-3-methyl-5-hydroxy-6-metoxy-1,4-benzoquinol methylase